MGDRFTVRIRSSRRSIAGYVTETRPDYDGNMADKGNFRYFSLDYLKHRQCQLPMYPESQMYSALCLSRIARYAPSPA